MTDGLAPSRLDRAELVSLLETLGSDNDEEVLAAARVLDTKVTAAGTSWNALLAAGVGSGADTAAEEQAPAGSPETASALPDDEAAKNAETLALIDKLLSRSGHSQAFRDELEGYKEDMAEGEFADSDHNYIRALYKRLSG